MLFPKATAGHTCWWHIFVTQDTISGSTFCFGYLSLHSFHPKFCLKPTIYYSHDLMGLPVAFLIHRVTVYVLGKLSGPRQPHLHKGNWCWMSLGAHLGLWAGVLLFFHFGLLVADFRFLSVEAGFQKAVFQEIKMEADPVLKFHSYILPHSIVRVAHRGNPDIRKGHMDSTSSWTWKGPITKEHMEEALLGHHLWKHSLAHWYGSCHVPGFVLRAAHVIIRQ